MYVPIALLLIISDENVFLVLVTPETHVTHLYLHELMDERLNDRWVYTIYTVDGYIANCGWNRDTDGRVDSRQMVR